MRPQLSGSFRVGSVVSATTGAWDNDPTGYAYAWQRCATNNSLASCTTITGVTQATYVLGVADDGFWIRVVVTASNSGGSRSRYSLPSVQVKRLRPVNTVRPVLSGSPQVGQALTTSTGAWDNVPAGYAYAWKRCTSSLLASCTTIDGATLSSYTLSSYTLTAQDAGVYIRAYVTATNSGGSSTRTPTRARRSPTPPEPVTASTAATTRPISFAPAGCPGHRSLSATAPRSLVTDKDRKHRTAYSITAIASSLS